MAGPSQDRGNPESFSRLGFYPNYDSTTVLVYALGWQRGSEVSRRQMNFGACIDGYSARVGGSSERAVTIIFLLDVGA